MMKAFRMNKPLLSAAALLLFASAPALAVEPFTANYQASYMGLNGIGKMTLEPQGDDRWKYTLRSEEHTSELQSLMRISYAVFCLKKKKDTQNLHITSQLV